MSDDPYRYFRIEARELLGDLNRGVLDLEKGGHDTELVSKLLRLAHTLKGAARVVKQPLIADVAHGMEEAFAQRRAGVVAISDAWSDEVARGLDAIARQLDTIDGPPTPAAAPGPHVPRSLEPLTTVRVEIAEMDGLLEDLSEVSARLAALRTEISDLARVRRAVDGLSGRVSAGNGSRGEATTVHDLSRWLETTERTLIGRVDEGRDEVIRLREVVGRLRLVPVAGLFDAFERAVRDTARSVGKRVDFEARGGEVCLDPHVLVTLRDALLHVMRNSVAHGIEAETQRRAAGKSAIGLIQVDVERRGNHVVFLCRDDGCGIDVAAVRRAAVDHGVLSAAAAELLPDADAVQLILQNGVTTAEAVTQVAGRGVGLDVLRDTVTRLKGTVTLSTERGMGTLVEVCVPISLSQLAALAVEASGPALLPLTAVRETMRLEDRDVSAGADGDRIVFEGRSIPYAPLVDAIGRVGKPHEGGAQLAVVLQAGSACAAFGVERLVGIVDVVVRPMPALVAADPVVASASIDADGKPQLLFDPAALIAVAAGQRPSVAAAPRPQRLPLLVIDDSLTTRMLEQSILESAGYEVELATSAEEALSKAKQRRYGVFIVDVEMPGMDGFEFVARTRADLTLKEVPAILVTSRNAPEDRRRGRDVGARGYIVKSEFDQGQLLGMIRELAG